jgi:predicted PurR-regulated permease PerM
VIVPAGLAFSNVMVGASVVAILYFAREILVPIALAVLLSFVLAPLVRMLQRLKVPRTLAVMGAVGTAFLITFSLATMVMVEVNQLANDLPRYETTLSEKIRNLRDAVGRAGLLSNASKLLKDLDRELNGEDHKAASAKSALPDNAQGRGPIPVEVHQPDPAASETLVAMLRPLVTPFTTTGIVIIFLIFFLFQREDLRNRFIRLVGSDDLERTTAALDDAGRRLGKLFLTQLILNATFGAVIGLGLAVIGVPSAPLWGLLAMILRFIPYIGAILAAALPIALAAAVGSDWSMALCTIALFAVVEPLTGQVVEPLVCGRSAGLSPVAVVVAASFWTWLWGPLGLLLSTPLTMCLVVLARHVDRLQFIDVMLGDQPALTPQQAAYQRMLTGDPIEAIEQARSFLTEGSVEAYYEEIVLGALRLAAADAALGRLDDKRLENIHQTVSDIVEDLGSYKVPSREKPREGETPPKANVVNIDTRVPGPTVICISGLGRLDDCVALVLTDFLKRGGIVARTAAAATAIENDAAETICVCFLEDVTRARGDFTIRKLSRQAPAAKVIVCLLGDSNGSNEEGGPDAAPRSLTAAMTAIEKSTVRLNRREQ